MSESTQRKIEQAVQKADPGIFGQVDNRSAVNAIMTAAALWKKPTTQQDWLECGYVFKWKSRELAILNSIQIPENLVNEIRSAREAVTTETKTKTTTLKDLFVARNASNDQVWNYALSSIKEGNKFRYINDQINKAVIKDIEGHKIEGGILGGVGNILMPNTNLKKAMDNIAKQYGQNVADTIQNTVLPKLASQIEIAHILCQGNINQAEKLGTNLSTIIGPRSASDIVNYWKTVPDFRNYASQKITSGLASLTLSSLSGLLTGTLYGGMIKIPGVTVQRMPTFSQDALANAISSGQKTASDYLQVPLNESGSFVSRAIRSQENLDERTKETAKEISIQLANGLVINVGGLIDKLNQSENRFRNFFDKVTLGLIDDERWLEKKLIEYGTLMQKTTMLTPSEVNRAYQLHGDLAEMLQRWSNREAKRTGKRAFNAAVSLQALSDTKTTTRLTSSSEAISRGARFESFLTNNIQNLEKMAPNKPEYRATYDAMMAYKHHTSYDGKSGAELAQHIWDSPNLKGAVSMFKAYTHGGKISIWEYENIYRALPAQTMVSPENDKYAGDITTLLGNGEAVSNYLATHTNRKNGQNIAARYSTVLQTIWWKYEFTVYPQDIIDNAKQGTKVDHFIGQNTGTSTTELKNDAKDIGPAHVFQVPAIIDGMEGLLTIWVKANCTNLVIGNFSQSRNPNNSEALISLRAPLLYALNRDGWQTKQECKEQDTQKVSNDTKKHTPPEAQPKSYDSRTGNDFWNWALDWQQSSSEATGSGHVPWAAPTSNNPARQ
jgi:hypothetical protein